ncbi:hypothetical protein HAX54_049918, partial [Datura stramonium]|nr:hypothetical protein [Datura stramonium]
MPQFRKDRYMLNNDIGSRLGDYRLRQLDQEQTNREQQKRMRLPNFHSGARRGPRQQY